MLSYKTRIKRIFSILEKCVKINLYFVFILKKFHVDITEIKFLYFLL